MADQRLSDEGILRLEQDLNEKSQRLNKKVQTLQSVIDSLEGQWKGIGAGAFNQKQLEINQAMNTLNRILAQYQEAIHQTRVLGANNEDEVSSTLTGVDVGMGAGAAGGAAAGSGLNAL
ncbi:WXG100 family type VII secretion target [Streptomyces sp. NPDC051940]|uniref:WXG100 family type VII secretion target n=1 Tax=Streptomyces sp. NPDC051940 TaxID=3155675 RepID=UPI003418078B